MSKPLYVKHVMVLVDGTATASRALDMAINISCHMRARLTALAMVETEVLRQLLSVNILTPGEMGEFEDDLQHSAKRHLAEARERALKQALEIECAIVRGNSELVVPQEVQERKVDLIVVGYFDSARAQRNLLARQRQQVVDHAPCPVLVAR